MGVHARVAMLLGGALLTQACLLPAFDDAPGERQLRGTATKLERERSLDKLDLLFVIDNSTSMADKQNLLALAIPGLIERFSNPRCISSDGESDRADSDGECPDGHGREFEPLADLHVGVITSSLGAHGGEVCAPEGSRPYNDEMNDRGRLIAGRRPEAELDSYQGLGFLSWQPSGDSDDNDDNAALLVDHVLATGERGCDFEAPLEAWYRFLVDPSPAAGVTVVNDIARAATDADGTVLLDNQLLIEREAFLRPDSVVVIVMLTDENDCSVQDTGIGYLTTSETIDGRAFSLPRATTACDSAPNSPCCRSCGLAEAGPPMGCAAINADPNCNDNLQEDPLNLRCYDQKRRFGLELLYPTARYLDGLTRQSVYDTARCTDDTCPQVANPLFVKEEGKLARDPSMVFLAGIVGVPWQDIATPDSLDDADTLVLRSAEDLLTAGLWDLILGDPEALSPNPSDPLMRESIVPREGEHPLTGEPVAPETSQDPNDNSINGHEYDPGESADDLQYACIFPLHEERDCTTYEGHCDCIEENLRKNLPLCNPPAGGAAGTTQYAAKAYPGTRLLTLLRDFGRGSVVASVCPKQTTGDSDDPVFGYNPAMTAIVDRLKKVWQPPCLGEDWLKPPESFDKAATTCKLLLATTDPDFTCSRNDFPNDLARAVRDSLTCEDCETATICELEELGGSARNRCESGRDSDDLGYCHVEVDADADSDTPLLHCGEGVWLRVSGKDLPKDRTVVSACYF